MKVRSDPNILEREACHNPNPYFWRCQKCGWTTPRHPKTHPQEVGPCPKCSGGLRKGQTKADPGVIKREEYMGNPNSVCMSDEFWK